LIENIRFGDYLKIGFHENKLKYNIIIGQFSFAKFV